MYPNNTPLDLTAQGEKSSKRQKQKRPERRALRVRLTPSLVNLNEVRSLLDELQEHLYWEDECAAQLSIDGIRDRVEAIGKSLARLYRHRSGMVFVPDPPTKALQRAMWGK